MFSSKACNDSTIENLHFLSHGNNDFNNEVKEAFYINKQKPVLNNTCTNMVHHFCSMYFNYD